MKDDFYIGWQPEAPDSYRQKIKRMILVLAVLVTIVGTAFVVSQRGFESSVFEFGTASEFEGYITKEPVPMLKIKKGMSFKSILLVGFGKRGAEADFEIIEKEKDINLEGVKVKLAGTRIYHNGKELLELTDGADSFLEIYDEKSLSPSNQSAIKEVSLKGEILDPKCAFGVMKPAEGKPHRSCAVRCISGGIPPVFRVTDEKGESRYCLLKGRNGEAINSDVLEYVADQVQICGELSFVDDWFVLNTNPASEILRLQPYWMSGDVPMCNNTPE